jgi:hypothetical protein
LLDVIQPGILGTPGQFRAKFKNIIEAGLKKNAGKELAILAKERIIELRCNNI